MIAFLVLETLMIGVFCALDLVLFYVFFEGGLIPMFLIIGIWGGKRRIYATFKFFLYTLLGSVLMLLAIMAMYWHAGTTDIPTLLAHSFPPGMQTWLWLAFFASFAVKLPMWPVHTWLPDAHVEAPTAGSVILAAILLKMGGYGFLRFSLPMFPDASRLFRAARLRAVGDRHHLHLAGRAGAGGHEEADRLFVGRPHGLRHHGHLLGHRRRACRARSSRCCRHGLVSGALFLCVGVVYDRMHTREIAAYGGLVNRMPLYAAAFMVFTMANVGLPGTSGFVGEFLTLLGAFQANTWVAFFATTGVILSAAYALWLYRRVIFGALDKPQLAGIVDLNGREMAILAPLVVLTILFGFCPAPVLDASAASVKGVVERLSAGARHGRDAGRRLLREIVVPWLPPIPSLLPALPEIVLALGALGLLDGRRLRRRAERPTSSLAARWRCWRSAAILVVTGEPGRIATFNGAFVVDRFARFMKVLTLDRLRRSRSPCRSTISRRAANPALRVSGADRCSPTLGMMMMISANDLIALYLGLELQSLALYVVAAIDRDNAALDRGRPEVFRPRRAVLGHAALRRLADLRLHRHGRASPASPTAAAGRHGVGIGLIFGLVFLIAGLAFKISAVPFHMWTPDVYEGAPTPVTAFFAAAPKIAAMALFVRVMVDALSRRSLAEWQQIVVFISIASMVLGAFAAIGQRNIKRLMAYSSIGHIGYALIGLAAGTADGRPAACSSTWRSTWS